MRRPLVGMISRTGRSERLRPAGGPVGRVARLNATFVLLGTGERRYEDLWLALAARHPERIGATIGFDEGLAHLIEGGADLFLMPSRFEPCGLNQMYSLRYGTVPLVHATGGLADTVRNFDSRDRGGNRVHVRRLLAAGAARYAAVGPRSVRRSRRVAAPSDQRACSRTIRGTRRLGSTSRYMSALPCSAYGRRDESTGLLGIARTRALSGSRRSERTRPTRERRWHRTK